MILRQCLCRRPGTAPPNGRNGPHAASSVLLLQSEVEALQSVLGSDTDQEVRNFSHGLATPKY